MRPLVTMDVVGVLSETFVAFASVLRGVDGIGLATGLSKFMDSLNGALRAWLTSFVASVASHSAKQVPKDGTVSEHTANTLGYARALLDYEALLQSRLPAGSWREAGEASGSGEARAATTPLGEYMCKVLRTLEDNIHAKARSYKVDSLRHIFLLNNFHYIVSSVRSSGLASVVPGALVGEFEAQEARAREKYQRTWDAAMTHLLDKNLALKASGGESAKLSKSDRENIKSRFSKFNAEFEAITAAAATYTVADPELRDALKAESKERLLPLYTQFVARYRDVSFTKNLYKYLKYMPETVAEKMDRAFA